MNANIAERDWKIFRELHGIALERMCARHLDQIQQRLAQPGTAVEKFWDTHESIIKSAKQIRNAFDDLRRSTALLQITIIRSLNLWTEEELNRFSPDLLQQTDPRR